MKIFRLFLFPALALALCLCGCNPCRYYASRCAPVESRVDSIWSHDTTIIERIITDTVQIVTLPHENAANAVFFTDTAQAETSLATARAYLNAGQLVLRLANKDTALLTVPKITENTRHITQSGQQSTVTHKVTEYRTKPFIKFLATIGGITLILLILYLSLKIAKRFI